MGRTIKAALLSTILFLSGCVSAPIENVAPVKAGFSSEYALMKESAVNQKELDCLTRNIYFEARGEPIRGMEAVAHVTINRVESGEFQSSVCSVVYAKNRRGCQFSWTCDRHIDRINDQISFTKARQVAEKVYINKPLDITHGAVYYHANYVHPYWAAAFHRTVVIGQHIFYRSAA